MTEAELESKLLALTEAEEAEIRAWALANGYEALKSFFYDEEGIDGWYWYDPERDGNRRGNWRPFRPIADYHHAHRTVARLAEGV